jgi:PAS domain S-box-containing protein
MADATVCHSQDAVSETPISCREGSKAGMRLGSVTGPAGDAPAGSTRRRVSLKAYVIGLAVLFVVVVAAGIVYEHVAATGDARRSGVRDAQYGAQTAARDVAAAISLAQTQIAGLAANPQIGKIFAAPAGCTLSFGGSGPFTAGHLDIVGRDGAVACSSLHGQEAAPYAGAAWLQGAVKAPVLAGPIADTRTGKQALVASAPIPGGAIVVFAYLDAVGPGLATTDGGPRHLEFLVTSADGKTAISRSIDPARWVGAKLAGTSFAQPGIKTDRRDLDGTQRLYGQATVPGLGWHIYAGASRAQALAAANRVSQRELAISLGGLLLFLGAAVVLYRRIARPIGRLSAGARAATTHTAKGPIAVSGPAEVAALVEDFNRLIAAAEQELTAASQLAAIVASSSDAILSLAPDGTVTTWNDGAEQMFGHPAGEVVGRNSSLLVPTDHGATSAALQRVAGGEPSAQFEDEWMHRDGHAVQVSVTASPIRDSAGEIAGISVLVRDIGDRNRAEAERRSLQDRLHQSQRMESLGQLAGGIAHDFNNLLGVILNYSQFVAEQAAGNEAVLADVQQIRAAAEQAVRLTSQLLTFGRRDPTEPANLDLNAVVAEVQTLLARSIGAHVEIDVRAAADLPTVRADRGHLEQVLVNLAVNARDAMPGGGTLTIETRVTDLDAEYSRLHPEVEQGRYVELAVSDTGTGMTSEVMEHIFEPFFTTKAKGEGTGLGMATVYSIVTNAGGSVNVYSEPGMGTTFRVYLPAVDAPVTAHPATDNRPAAVGHGETILVVEDEPAMLEVTARMLRRNGYAVLEATGYEQALSLAAEHDFQLLLTDSVMPLMAGRDLANQLGELHPDRPVLFMSGYSEGVTGPQGVLDRGVTHLQKPFDEQTLLESVNQALHDPRERTTSTDD